MSNDEIKIALRKKCPIRYDGAIYRYAAAWRCAVDSVTGKFISSLELVSFGNSLVVALADRCEMIDDNK